MSYISYRDALHHINSSYVNSKTVYVMYLLTLKKLTLHFRNPLVIVALKFYVVTSILCNFNF